MGRYLSIARLVITPPSPPPATGYAVAADVPVDVAARGLDVQAQLDAAFDALPAHLQDTSAIEAPLFWIADGDEMRRRMDARDWPGLLTALERHLDHGLALYGWLREKGALHEGRRRRR